MRWVFLLLVILNVFYYVWHQQEAPLKPKEVASLSTYKGGQQNIRLLSESSAGSDSGNQGQVDAQCIYLGGDISQGLIKTLQQRLVALDIRAQVVRRSEDAGGVFWVRIAPESGRLVDEALVGRLREDFPQIKNKIMSCEGIATVE